MKALLILTLTLAACAAEPDVASTGAGGSAAVASVPGPLEVGVTAEALTFVFNSQTSNCRPSQQGSTKTAALCGWILKFGTTQGNFLCSGTRCASGQNSYDIKPCSPRRVPNGTPPTWPKFCPIVNVASGATQTTVQYVENDPIVMYFPSTGIANLELKVNEDKLYQPPPAPPAPGRSSCGGCVQVAPGVCASGGLMCPVPGLP